MSPVLSVQSDSSSITEKRYTSTTTQTREKSPTSKTRTSLHLQRHLDLLRDRFIREFESAAVIVFDQTLYTAFLFQFLPEPFNDSV
jgi:hypothetical protein